MRTVRKSAPSPFIFHSVFLTVTHGFRASYIQPTWKAWMGPPLQQSVTQPVIARYVRLSASPCRLSRAHASGESVHAAGGQRVRAGCRSCVGKRCIVSALTRCVANDNRRILRLSSVGSLPLAKNALHSPTSYYHSYSVQCMYIQCMYIVHVHAILLSKLLLYTYQYHCTYTHMHIIRTADYISQHSNIYLTSSTHCVQERQPTCPQTSGEYVRLTFLTQSWPR